MATLRVSGQPLEFATFWSDPGLVVMALERPLPPNWWLCAIGEHAGTEHGLLLCEPDDGEPARKRQLIGVPVPRDWAAFRIELIPFSTAGRGTSVTLTFRRPEKSIKTKTAGSLSFYVEKNRIVARTEVDDPRREVLLRLHQNVRDDKTIEPSTRFADISAAAYRLDVQPSAGRARSDAAPAQLPDYGEVRIKLHTKDDDAMLAIKSTTLWLARHMLAAPNEATVGAFTESKLYGLTKIQGTLLQKRTMEFIIPAPTPGDVLFMALGLAEAVVNMGTDVGPNLQKLSNGLLAFELTPSCKLSVLNFADATWRAAKQNLVGLRADEVIKGGAGEQRFTAFLSDLIKPLRAGRPITEDAEIERLINRIPSGAILDHTKLKAIGCAAHSSIEFALLAALFSELLDGRTQDTADKRQEAAALLDVAQISEGGLGERICSSALWRAASLDNKRRNEDSPRFNERIDRLKTFRRNLQRLAGSPNPKSEGDGLQTLFKARFEGGTGSSIDSDLAKNWYDNNSRSALNAVALLALARISHDAGAVFVKAGVLPDLDDVVGNAFISLAEFCDKYLLWPLDDPTLAEALVYTCKHLAVQSDLKAAAEIVQTRIQALRAPRRAGLSVDYLNSKGLRMLLDELRDATVFAKIGRIRDTLDIDNDHRAIPPLESVSSSLQGRGADEIKQHIRNLKLPAHWRMLCEEARDENWPLGALAVLFMAIHRHGSSADQPMYESNRADDIAVRTQILAATQDAAEAERATGIANAARILFEHHADHSPFITQLRKRAATIRHETKNKAAGMSIPEAVIEAITAHCIVEDLHTTFDKHRGAIKVAADRVKTCLNNSSGKSPDTYREIAFDLKQHEESYGAFEEKLEDASRMPVKNLFAPETLDDISTLLSDAIEFRINLSRLLARLQEIDGSR